jgi:hypothetical protein
MTVFFIDLICAIFRKLFDGVVISEDVAVDTTQERNGDFENRNK